jgi:hypothetical protein
MLNITDKLKKIDVAIVRNIETAVLSIYKINKTHHLFASLLTDNPILEDAEYIVYPNINNSTAKVFLNFEGIELLKYTSGISEFILLPCDFETSSASISINNPYAKNFSF